MLLKVIIFVFFYFVLMGLLEKLEFYVWFIFYLRLLYSIVRDGNFYEGRVVSCTVVFFRDEYSFGILRVDFSELLNE